MAAVSTRSARRAQNPSGEFRPGPHVELPVDAGEIRLDRVHRNEQRRRYFLVRLALGDQLGHLTLGRRQLLPAGSPSTDAAQLVPGLALPQRRAELLEDAGRPLQQLPGGPTLLRPAPEQPEREERSA